MVKSKKVRYFSPNIRKIETAISCGRLKMTRAVLLICCKKVHCLKTKVRKIKSRDGYLEKRKVTYIANKFIFYGRKYEKYMAGDSKRGDFCKKVRVMQPKDTKSGCL